MELKRYLSVLWKWSWLIVLAALLAGGSSYWRSQQMPRLYQSSTTLMVGRFIDDPSPNNQDFNISQQLAQTYARMVKTRPILEATVDAVGLDMSWQALSRQVNASPGDRTQLLTVSVVDTDPERAQRLAEEIGRQLILQSPTTPSQDVEQNREFVREQLKGLESKIVAGERELEALEQERSLENSARGLQDIQDQIGALEQKIDLWQSNYANLLGAYEGSSTNYLRVLEPATVPGRPISPDVQLNVLLAVAFGLALSTAGALAIEYLSDVIENKEDVQRVLSLPVLGTIARIEKTRTQADHLVTLNNPQAPVSETFRFLRTSILFSGLSNSALSLLITSADVGEGKSTVAANLAIVMARAGKDVVLIDTDLRRPRLHRFFDISNEAGLTSLLLDPNRAVESVLIETEVAGLKIIPSGPLPPNPAELLMSAPMQQKFNELKDLVDVVIFDSPPLMAVDDATILGTYCDGVVLVIDAGQTRSGTAKRSKETLERVGAKIIGVALNKLPTHRSGYYYHYSYLPEDAPEQTRVTSKAADL